MNAVVQPPQNPTIKAMQVLVIGKVKEARKRGENWYTDVVCPAADAYSSPATVSIRSTFKIGNVGAELRQICNLGGYGRRGKDGEGESVTYVTNTLDAVE